MTVAQIVMAIVFAILLVPASMLYGFLDAMTTATYSGHAQNLEAIKEGFGISMGWIFFWAYVLVCSFLVWLIGKAKR